jgi:tetratricopeptide (TPR) repeat protein
VWRIQRWRSELAVLVLLCLTFAAGCQQWNRVPQTATPLVASADPSPPITSKQAADVQLAMGRSFEKQGDTVRAQLAYQEAEKKDPRRAEITMRLAMLLDRQGKFQESGACYRRALQASPNNAEVLCNFGYSLYLQRRWAEAEINLKTAIAAPGDAARAHNNLGLVYARTERHEDALAEFRKGGCSAADAQVNLAFALTFDGHWDRARQHYKLALAANPSSESAKSGLKNLDGLFAKAQGANSPHQPTAFTGQIVPCNDLPEGSSSAKTSIGFRAAGPE